ncbi:hypothetical protein COU15_00050 [Candidatus Kaiserbacteria bacterium CG10_big_fil_rev_8_21_14_0_10_45_20]|uniref:OmpR/PhoB-type domain-containing protein n=1 Tax=Candidatus Kaiserbacteria bacterium CG10_big_fil_rev_8_21_14_0_10_45_20 TaxID=1974607 RepID=A0A2H0UGC6_9BACT|nr:MAG: hypothetical protein COU15_00050 [Candidatus Kaiserbacteria bacterium CG10_big_fil_rev_8_21_14_0_10_45_20]
MSFVYGMERYDPHQSLLDKISRKNDREGGVPKARILFNCNKQCIYYNRKKVHLKPQEFQLLWLLYRANGAVLRNAELENFLYDQQLFDNADIPLTSDSCISAAVFTLGKKLRAMSDGKVTIVRQRNVGGYALSVS